MLKVALVALWIDPLLFLRRLLQSVSRDGILVVLKVALLAFWIGTFLSGVHILEAPRDENVCTPVRSGVLQYNSFRCKSV